MNDQSPHPSSTVPKQPFVTTWKLAGLIVLGLTLISCCCCGVVFTNLKWDDQNTHEDFETNQERLDYLNGVLPFSLPANATIHQFKIQGFQDWFLEAEMSLPPTEVPTFLDSIPGLEPSDADNHYESRFGADEMKLRVNPDTGHIWIEFLET